MRSLNLIYYIHITAQNKNVIKTTYSRSGPSQVWPGYESSNEPQSRNTDGDAAEVCVAKQRFVEKRKESTRLGKHQSPCD